MKPWLLAAVPALVLIFALPFLPALIITMTTNAAAECLTQRADLLDGDPPSVVPPGGSVVGNVSVAHANIPNRTSRAGFESSMKRVLSTDPALITLNEVSGRSLRQIKRTAPGYDAWREPASATGPGSGQSMGNVVLWKRDGWTRVKAGRTRIVDDDHAYFRGRRVIWDRYATWAMLERADGAVVSIVSVHHMTNPKKFPRQHGNPPLTRARQYGAGMDVLVKLLSSLSRHGPVLVGGDMNTHASATDLRWSAVSKMQRAGYGWHNHGVDYIFFPRSQGARLVSRSSGAMASDHHWVAADIAFGANATDTANNDAASSATTAAATSAAPEGDTIERLTQLRLADSYPPLTARQAQNAALIAREAQQIGVPRYGLQVAIATAIQESKLENLPGGDRDSRGLFQQRPSTGWGTGVQVTDPSLAARAFFGRAEHTSNPGLLDIDGWSSMPLAQAAQAVQRSKYPHAYAQWESVSGDITEILAADLPGQTASATAASQDCAPEDGTEVAITVATLNILGAGHTDKGRGGGKTRSGFAGWAGRLPPAMSKLSAAGVSIAALQEVHGPQRDALASDRYAQWGMFPTTGRAQNVVVWDRSQWRRTSQQMVKIPYFGGRNVGMPLVKLTSSVNSESVWVWSVHNPANAHGPARHHRREALRRQHATVTKLVSTGLPVFLMGDFNDGKDGAGGSHCVLTPTLSNAFGGSAKPCRPPKAAAPVDHIYGGNVSWASARVDRSTQHTKISDHPLVVASTRSNDSTCAVRPGKYNLGPVKPELAQLVDVLAPKFDIDTVGGYRASARDPGGHPSGLAADFMVPVNAAGKRKGDALAAYARRHADRLGVDYIIWYQRIWSVSRANQGWRGLADRGGPTQNHLDHVHINVRRGATVTAPTTAGMAPGQSCGEVVAPLPGNLMDTDNRNWRGGGSRWASWHTGTDYSVPCGTPVYAVHSGTVEVDTDQPWSGPWLVKVVTGPGKLTTWYAHMRTVSVSRGEKVRAGQQIGQVGSEGNSTGCHLHLEVHTKNGSIYGADNVNPTTWLAQHLSKASA